MNERHHILVKTNSFVRFLEESSASQFAFEINWPLKEWFFDDKINHFSLLTLILNINYSYFGIFAAKTDFDKM